MQSRDLFSDFILILIKEIIAKFKNIKVVIIGTAAISELIQKFFPLCPIMMGNLRSYLFLDQKNFSFNSLKIK